MDFPGLDHPLIQENWKSLSPAELGVSVQGDGGESGCFGDGGFRGRLFVGWRVPGMEMWVYNAVEVFGQGCSKVLLR